VLKHLRKGTLALDGLRTLVLDEADRMLDMGFADELDAILEHVPKRRQTLLFSATYPQVIAAMSARVQNAPVRVDVVGDAPAPRIAQHWCAVEVANREEALVAVLHAFGGALNLVFCNTKADCARVTGVLQAKGVAALALHGDLDQSQRSEVMVRFANRSASVLVATDVAARGLDVKDLDAVFNYELPREPDVYVHRIGRTARAGEAGVAVSLVAKSERWRLEAVREAQPDGELAEQALPVGSPARAVAAPLMTTLQINGGRRNKLRPGDLLGTLTAAGGVPGEAVGRIDVLESCSFVAVYSAQAQAALKQLASRPIKGRQYRARLRR
jgi:ATP-independent RNA helicase DbpA